MSMKPEHELAALARVINTAVACNCRFKVKPLSCFLLMKLLVTVSPPATNSIHDSRR